MAAKKTFLALDVGDKRVGMALANSDVKIAVPFGYVERGDKVIQQLVEVILQHQVNIIVIGYPRNQSGEATRQTEATEAFVKELARIDIDATIVERLALVRLAGVVFSGVEEQQIARRDE